MALVDCMYRNLGPEDSRLRRENATQLRKNETKARTPNNLLSPFIYLSHYFVLQFSSYPLIVRHGFDPESHLIRWLEDATCI